MDWKKWNRTRTRMGRSAIWAVALAAAVASAASDSLDAMDDSVGRWMELRATLAREQREWDERRAQWEKELSLLKRESESLEAGIAAARGRTEALESERNEQTARKKELQDALDRLRAIVGRAEERLKAWAGRVPESLALSAIVGFQNLPESPAEADKLSLPRRAQAVASLYAQIEALQQGVHGVREALDTGDGGRRQVDVLYIGLARAFAVSPGNDWAAVGVPGEAGWTWSPRPALAADIRTAIDVHQRRETARLVRLPLRVEGEKQP